MKPVHALLGNVLVPTAQTRNPLARKSRLCCHVVGG
jgi:hypothetical protein